MDREGGPWKCDSPSAEVGPGAVVVLLKIATDETFLDVGFVSQDSYYSSGCSSDSLDGP